MVGIENGYRRGMHPVNRKNFDNPRAPLRVGLCALADLPGIVDNFPQTLAEFLKEGNYPSGVKRILQFARDFNNVTLSLDHLVYYGYFPLEINVYMPLGDGEKSVDALKDAKSGRATFLGITSARKDANSIEVIFDGLAVPLGQKMNTDNTVRVSINPRTGRADVDPKFAEAMLRATAGYELTDVRDSS